MSEWEDIKARLSVGFMGHVSDGSCKAEKPCMGCDIRAALEEIEQGRKARVALQEALGSHNVENPWLGICAAVALLQMGRNKLAEANRNAEAERSATWARLDKAEAEVERLRGLLARCEPVFEQMDYIAGIVERGEGKPITGDETVPQAVLRYVKGLEAELARLREALESIIKVQSDQTIWPAYSNEKGRRMDSAIDRARAALRRGGKPKAHADDCPCVMCDPMQVRLDQQLRALRGGGK